MPEINERQRSTVRQAL